MCSSFRKKGNELLSFNHKKSVETFGYRHFKDNDNIYYSKLALAEQDRNGVKLVDIPKNIVDNVRKKTHFGYQQVINKRKDKIARQTKTESFLSELNKKKHT